MGLKMLNAFIMDKVKKLIRKSLFNPKCVNFKYLNGLKSSLLYFVVKNLTFRLLAASKKYGVLKNSNYKI